MIKNIILLFASLLLFAGLAKAQVSSVTGQYLQDNNILLNPGFESGIGKWVNSAGTFSIDYSSFVQGKAVGKIVLSTQTLNFYQDSVMFQGQFADNSLQGIGIAYVKTSVAGVKLCARKAGVTSTSLCVTHTGSGKWELLKIPFILGGTSNGVALVTSGNVTGTVLVDETFAGAVNLQAVSDQSRFLGAVAYGAGASASGWRTYTGTGTVQSGSSGFSYNDTTKEITLERAGDYKLDYYASYGVSTAGSGVAIGLFVNGVGEVCTEVALGGADTGPRPIATCNLKNLPANSKIILRQYTSSALAGNAGYLGVFYFAVGNTYSSTNADTDWQSCGHTTSDFTGFGTVSNIQTQCKRQGSDLLIKGNFTPGTGTAVEARVALKFNGSYLTSASSPIIPALQIAGDLRTTGFSSTYFTGSTLIEPSVGYITIGSQTSTSTSLNKSNGSIWTGGTLSFSARVPIDGWENSNIIIGQFNGLESCTNTLECTDVFSAKVSSSGVVTDENTNWINGNCSSGGTGFKVCSFNTGVFTVTPNCQMVSGVTSTTNFLTRINASSSSSVTFLTMNASGTPVDGPFEIMCQKQGVDYIGKTAKAVASDQNVRSIGAIGVDIQSVFFGSGAGCTSVCSTGTCTICGQVGGKITSVQYSSPGIYLVNGIDSTKYICSGTGHTTTASVALSHARTAGTPSIQAVIEASGTNVRNATFTCIGVP